MRRFRINFTLALVLPILTSIGEDVSGQIIYQDLEPDATIGNVESKYLYFDINTDGLGDFTIHNVWDSYQIEDYNELYVWAVSPNRFYTAPIDSGTEISANLTWSQNDYLGGFNLFYDNYFGDWAYATDKYLGIKIVINSVTYYGWLRCDALIDEKLIVVKDFAYHSDPDQSIIAGDKGCSGNPVTPQIAQQGDTLISSIENGNQWFLNDVEINGAISDSLVPLQNGIYRTRVTDIAGCLTQSPIFNFVFCDSIFPVIVDYNGDTSSHFYCNVASASLHLTNVPTNFQLQWYCNDTLIESEVASTFHATVHDTSFYYVMLNNPITGCSDTSNKITFYVHQTPVPMVMQSHDTLFSSPANSYQWMKGYTNVAGATNSFYNPTVTYNYFVRITDSFDCEATSDQYYFYECWYLDHDLTLYGDSLACSGDYIALSTNSNHPNCSYDWRRWFLGDWEAWIDYDTLLVVNQSGAYFCEIHDDSADCYIPTSTIYIDFADAPQPIIISVGDTLYTIPADSFQWKMNGMVISGATNQWFVPEIFGTYTVEVWSDYGCNALSDDYGYYAVSSSGHEPDALLTVTQDEDHLVVSFAGSNPDSYLSLISVWGSILLREPVTSLNVSLDKSALCTGIYFLQWANEDQRILKKVFIY